MDLKKCRILLDAIDCRNLSKVAKDYGYTPSGVRHMIDAIENELGFPLFLRGSGEDGHFSCGKPSGTPHPSGVLPD